jgi:DNA-directed RNA polymerase sigma subunit (sigma70/sigma32)
LDRAARPLSLSGSLSDDGDTELADVVADPSATCPCDAAVASVLPREIVKHLEPLTRREREVVVLRAGLDRGQPRTLGDVGRFFEVSRERIRQIEGKALAKLRHPSFSTALRELLVD